MVYCHASVLLQRKCLHIFSCHCVYALSAPYTTFVWATFHSRMFAQCRRDYLAQKLWFLLVCDSIESLPFNCQKCINQIVVKITHRAVWAAHVRGEMKWPAKKNPGRQYIPWPKQCTLKQMATAACVTVCVAYALRVYHSIGDVPVFLSTFALDTVTSGNVVLVLNAIVCSCIEPS